MRIFWGAFDVSYSTPEYTGTQIKSGGASAVTGSGVGVRRAVLVFNRTPPGTFTDDVADMHFDFMNLTGGNPDDTWTTTDFTDLEGYLNAWWTSVKVRMSTSHSLREFRWYRVGTGVIPPNPAQRITPVGTAGTSSGSMLPPQCACAITLKTGRRKQWGRTYFPGLPAGSVTGNGQLGSGTVDDLATATNALLQSAATKGFNLGVTSDIAGSFFTADHIQVDDVVDIIRRRRWRNPTYRKVLP